MAIPSPDLGKRELVWEMACGTLLLVGTIAYRLIMSPHIRAFAAERAARRVATSVAR